MMQKVENTNRQIAPLVNNPNSLTGKHFDEMTDYVKKQYAHENKGMMQHVELKYYWLYEYLDADGAKFKSTLKLSDEQMDQNDLTLNKEIQIHYTEEIAK